MTQARSHFPGLDGLRGIAILAVFGHNLQLLEDPNGRIATFVEWGLDRGWIGVQLFFVLSGFLITGILLDSGKAPNYFKSFFARRALRIFPIYFLALACLFLLLPALGVVPPSLVPSPREQLPFWFYVSNWTQPTGFDGGPVTHFWSLAVEEQFYLLWPFLLWGRSAKAALGLSLAVAAAALAIRLAMLGHGAIPTKIYMYSVCRMDALALGGAMAAAWRVPALSQWIASHHRAMFWAGAAVLLAGLVVTHGYPRLAIVELSYGYSILSVALALVVGSVAAADTFGGASAFSPLRSRFLRQVGKFSYAIYVMHRPVGDLIGARWVKPWLPNPDSSVAATLVYLAVMFVVCFALAALSFRFIEQPFLKLKRLFVAEAPAQAPATSTPAIAQPNQ